VSGDPNAMHTRRWWLARAPAMYAAAANSSTATGQHSCACMQLQTPAMVMVIVIPYYMMWCLSLPLLVFLFSEQCRPEPLTLVAFLYLDRHSMARQTPLLTVLHPFVHCIIIHPPLHPPSLWLLFFLLAHEYYRNPSCASIYIIDLLLYPA
jgi:hypothetical protein